jgi:hypothetical protein
MKIVPHVESQMTRKGISCKAGRLPALQEIQISRTQTWERNTISISTNAGHFPRGNQIPVLLIDIIAAMQDPKSTSPSANAPT